LSSLTFLPVQIVKLDIFARTENQNQNFNLEHSKIFSNLEHMEGFEIIWSKRLENADKTTALYQERASLLQTELELTRELLRDAKIEIQQVKLFSSQLILVAGSVIAIFFQTNSIP